MSEILARIRMQIGRGNVVASVHGFRELAADDILLDDLTNGIADAILVEEYPEAFKGPSVLVLQHDRLDRPLHVLWGIPKGKNGPATIITAYRPSPERWTDNFMRRKP